MSEVNHSEDEPSQPLGSRRIRHPKEPIRLRDVMRKLLSPFEPAPRFQRAHGERAVHMPSELPNTSRFRARRRTLRLRRARRLRVEKWTKRTLASVAVLVVLISVLFWAKFAIVYHVPSYLQQGRLAGVHGYVVFKSWWFGPPSFNLSDYDGMIDPANPISSLALELERYQDIVTNPAEILFTW